MVTLAHFLDQKLQRFDKNLKSQSELEYKKEQEKMQNELEVSVHVCVCVADSLSQMMQQRLMQSDDGGYEMKRIMRAPDETSESD